VIPDETRRQKDGRLAGGQRWEAHLRVHCDRTDHDDHHDDDDKHPRPRRTLDPGDDDIHPDSTRPSSPPTTMSASSTSSMPTSMSASSMPTTMYAFLYVILDVHLLLYANHHVRLCTANHHVRLCPTITLPPPPPPVRHPRSPGARLGNPNCPRTERFCHSQFTVAPHTHHGFSSPNQTGPNWPKLALNQTVLELNDSTTHNPPWHHTRTTVFHLRTIYDPNCPRTERSLPPP